MTNTDDMHSNDAAAAKRNSVGTANGVEYAAKVDEAQDRARMKVYGDAERITYTEEENKRVVRKIDLILLPMLCGCYMFSVSLLHGLLRLSNC